MFRSRSSLQYDGTNSAQWERRFIHNKDLVYAKQLTVRHIVKGLTRQARRAGRRVRQRYSPQNATRFVAESQELGFLKFQ